MTEELVTTSKSPLQSVASVEQCGNAFAEFQNTLDELKQNQVNNEMIVINEVLRELMPKIRSVHSGANDLVNPHGYVFVMQLSSGRDIDARINLHYGTIRQSRKLRKRLQGPAEQVFSKLEEARLAPFTGRIFDKSSRQIGSGIFIPATAIRSL